MSFKNVKGSQVDLTEYGEEKPFTVLIIGEESITIEDRPTKKFLGYAPDGQAVEFLASSQLENVIKVGKLFQITFVGTKDLKGGKSLNLFTVDEWEGDLPEWCEKFVRADA